MANCETCGKKLGVFAVAVNGQCHDCANARFTSPSASNKYDHNIEAILLTTETATNLKIIKRIEIVTAECAFGMNIFKDLFAGVRDIVW